MDTSSNSKYAILNRTTKLRLYYSPDVPWDTIIGDCKTDGDDEITLPAGMLIKLIKTKTTMANSGSKSNTTVQVWDMVNKMQIYDNTFECPWANLLPVDENLWPYVISIEDPELRFHMVQDTKHCKWVTSLKLNNIVSVTGDMFGMDNLRFDCIIHFIGCVHELHPVGYFFGLELLNLSSGFSPQAEAIPFAKKYINADPKLSIFTTANWLLETSKEVIKKSSTRDIFSVLGDKFIAAIVPNNTAAGATTSNTSSLKRNKKSKGKSKEPTAQFYEKITTDVSDSVSEEMRNAGDNTNVIPLDNEEFTRKYENCDRNLEQRSTSTAQTQTNPQSGILKNKCKDQFKPSTGRKLAFRDVLIDNTDIEESQRNESDVVGENEIGLIELLRDDWPESAGDTAAILNKQKMQPSNHTRQSTAVGTTSTNTGGSTSTGNVTQSKHNNRNKSLNPLSHLGTVPGSTKAIKNIDKKFQKTKRTKSPIRDKSYRPQTFNENYDKNSDKESQPIYANESSDAMIVDTDGYDAPELLPAVLDSEFVDESPMRELPGTDLGVGSMVEINVPDFSGHLYGVIRWIGIPPSEKEVMVGVELEEDYIDKQLNTTNGGIRGIPLFKCPPGRGMFVTSEQVSSDSRFPTSDGAVGNDISVINNNFNKTKLTNGKLQEDQQTFGHMECPIVPGAVAPIKCLSLNELEDLCGKFKGIQGHHNSCYLDVTLFSMFTFTPVFDSVLYRPPDKDDIPNYTEVQNVLREEIVNPLRKNMFVRADRVMKLRQLLDKLSSVSGLTSEEKDPEEFLNCLLAQILRAEPFLKLNSGQDAYYYQLFVEKDERLSFPTVQQLFEQSFYTSDIKLKEVPSCLIIQMPRFGKNYKMYPRILPSQVLDVTDIIEDSPRQCSICGKLAEFECRDCFGILQSGLESTSFCPTCLETVHMHGKRSNHKHRKLSVPQDFRVMADHMTAPRLYMELFAVVCIETSHYVTFVKAGSGPDAPWCFFDSMADRKGELNGYNIPEMITVPDLPQWLSDEGSRIVNETSSNDKMLPEHAKRLFCDAYMCMYQSSDVMMYR